MALRVWLPLNGNLNNQGLSDYSLKTMGTGIVFNTNGKIGKSVTFPNSPASCLYIDGGLKMQNLTWTCWFKSLGAGSGTSQRILSEGRDTGNRGVEIWLSKDGLTLNAFARGKGFSTSTTINTWHHVALVAGDTEVSLYLDGALINTVSPSAANDYAQSSDAFVIGKMSYSYTATTNYFPFNGYINDVRVYDEALSLKQIKEISKGLVAHYKLDTARTLNNLKRNANYSPYNNFSSAGATCTVVKTGEKFNGAEVWRMTYTPVESNLSNVQTTLHGHGVYTASATYKANTKYCYWTLCKLISHPDTIVGGTASNIGGWIEIPMKKYNEDWYIVGQYRSGAVTTDKSDNIFTSFKTPSAVAGIPIIIDFCCPHLVEGYDYIVPEFDYIGTTLSYEPESSGYGYDGTQSGTLSYNSDSPRYSGSTNFSTNTCYLQIPTMDMSGFANSFTIVYWAKITDMNGKMAWGFEDGNRLNIYPTGSVICCNTGDSANNPYQNNGTSIGYSQWNNGWHQFAMTADGTSNKLYIDGVLQGTSKTYKGITGTKLYISGWASNTTNFRWTGGSISDFRIYATALSADDILTMYKNSGIIDNKGNVYAYEFKEE